MKNIIEAFAIVFVCLPILAAAQSSYTISGELRDDAGQLFSGGNVCALQRNGNVVNVRDKVCAESDAQGKFIINISQAGTYQIIADKLSAGYMPSYLPFYRDPKAAIPEVTLGGGSPSQMVSVKLAPKSGVIGGKVIDEATDRRVPNFVVWVWQARDSNARTHQVVNGQSGTFRILAPNQPFRMRVVADGYEDWVMGGGVLVSQAGARRGPGSLLMREDSETEFAVYLKPKNPSPIDPAAATMRLPPPIQLAPRDNQIFDVFPRNTKLEWNPVAGATSYAIEVESCWRPSAEEEKRLPDDGACTNPSSFVEKYGLKETSYEFIFKGAQPGRWRVWAFDQDHRPGIKTSWRRFTYLK
ncbi:MAG: carboxypeptidase-like regulatory domain-containing protein [Pyrinomonadaceae bacterium]